MQEPRDVPAKRKASTKALGQELACSRKLEETSATGWSELHYWEEGGKA